MFTKTLRLAAAATVLAGAALAQNNPPFCDEGGVWIAPCQGATTSITVVLNSYDPDGDPLTYQWNACPGSFITDPTSAVTDVVLDTSSSCDVFCGVRLRVTDPEGLHYTCRLYVQVTPGTQGCTPGYWKNHEEAWHDSGFNPTDDFDTVFGVDAFTPDITLMQALNLGGGKLNKLARHGVAALLNGGDMDVSYGLAAGEVIDLVHDAIVNGAYEPLATNLDTMNNGEGGCPQSATNY
ncbi:MAG: hypothetical protein HUU28_00780 [Planctomycetaceae bacterium]|nr:hypothetical protein [Planctomycetaceae bacterium]